MNFSKAFSAFFLAVVLLVLAALMYVGYFAKAIFTPVSTNSETYEFVIEKGEGVNQISQRLLDQKLIKSQWNFEVYVWLQGWGRNIQAGQYTVRRDINIHDLAQLLVTGKDASGEKRITIIEGWTSYDIANYLETNGLVKAEDFLAIASLTPAEPLSVLGDKPQKATLEGYLFPDTYRVFAGSSSQDIIEKLVANLDSKLTPELRQQIKAKNLSIFETLIMASIVEKEVKNSADLRVVADIFWRRLKAGQRLESDATLNYVLKSSDPSLSAEDLKNPSPYNTYKHYGLPPGPIANPGLGAIEAAVNPQPNEYWFFLTGSDGQTRFAKTYAEHLNNKRLYLK